MDYNYFLYENIIIIELEGDLLGVSQEESLLQMCMGYLKTGDYHCIIDLRKIHYMNSTGLSFLVRMFTAMKEREGRTILVNPSSQAVKLLEITKLNRVFSLAYSRSSAIHELE